MASDPTIALECKHPTMPTSRQESNRECGKKRFIWKKSMSVQINYYLCIRENPRLSTFSGTLSTISGICQLVQENMWQPYQEKSKKMSTEIRKRQKDTRPLQHYNITVDILIVEKWRDKSEESSVEKGNTRFLWLKPLLSTKKIWLEFLQIG